MRANEQAWTRNEKLTLAEAWLSERPRAEIARVMGRTVSSVTSAACKMSLPSRANTGEGFARDAVIGRIRPCMTCGDVMHSEGPHHRMCLGCRDAA